MRSALYWRSCKPEGIGPKKDKHGGSASYTGIRGQERLHSPLQRQKTESLNAPGFVCQLPKRWNTHAFVFQNTYHNSFLAPFSHSAAPVERGYHAFSRNLAAFVNGFCQQLFPGADPLHNTTLVPEKNQPPTFLSKLGSVHSQY